MRFWQLFKCFEVNFFIRDHFVADLWMHHLWPNESLRVSWHENCTKLLQNSAHYGWGDRNSMSLAEVPELWVPVLGLVAFQTVWAHTSHTGGHPFMWNTTGLQVEVAGKVSLASITVTSWCNIQSIWATKTCQPSLFSLCGCNLKCLRWTHLTPSLASLCSVGYVPLKYC